MTGPRAFGDRPAPVFAGVAGRMVAAAIIQSLSRPPRARAVTPAQMAALEALSHAGAFLVQTMRGGVVIDARKRRTNVPTNTARSLIRYGWTEVSRRRILATRECFQITDAGRHALAAAKARARGHR